MPPRTSLSASARNSGCHGETDATASTHMPDLTPPDSWKPSTKWRLPGAWRRLINGHKTGVMPGESALELGWLSLFPQLRAVCVPLTLR